MKCSMDTETTEEAAMLEKLDQGIARAVAVLREGGVETFESCEGGANHASPVPIVRFYGEYAEGFRAYSIAVTNGLAVTGLRRVYQHDSGELKGPWWELTFAPTKAVDLTPFSV